MKKVFAVLAIVAMLAALWFGPGIAAELQRLGGYTALLSNTTFNNVTTATNTTGYMTLINEKTAFFVKYVETGNPSVMDLTIVPQVSQDDLTYLNMTFYDVAGTTTLQTSEVIAANGTYYFWLPDEAITPYVRINMVQTNSTAVNTTSVQTYVVGSINPGK